MAKQDPRTKFTIGIEDDVTNLSIEGEFALPDTTPTGFLQDLGPGRRRHGGRLQERVQDHRPDHTDKYVQAYFQYDSKKSGGLTISHLRFW